MSFRYLYCGAWNFKGEIKGIRVFWSDKKGAVTDLGACGLQPGESILCIAGKYVVAVCELGREGKVVSYAIRDDGTLEEKDCLQSSSSKLSYCTASPDGKYVFVSSMGDGTVKMIRLGGDGKLTLTDEIQLTGHSVTPRQNQAKVHSCMISPDGSLLAAANLGADEVELFSVDYEKERLHLSCSRPIDFGKEPRHMAFRPDGKYLYVLTEGGNRIYDFLVRGSKLQELAVYDTLDPDGEQAGAAADIVVSHDGRFVYSTNRTQSNIAVWKVLESGRLDIVKFVPAGGKGPRGINISPDGETLFCANNDEGTVTILPLDRESGIPGTPEKSLPVPFAGCVRSM